LWSPRLKHPRDEILERGEHRKARAYEQWESTLKEPIRAADGHPQEGLQDVVSEIRKRTGRPWRERLTSLGIEEDVACSDQLLMQLGVPEQAIAREVCYLSDGAARARFLLRHDLQAFIRRAQDATLDGHSTFEVRKGLVQDPRNLDLPVDAINVSTRVAENLQNFVAEAHGLDARLARRVHGLVEAPARELRLDDSLSRRLRVLDVEVQQAQVEIAGLCGWPKDRATRGMEGVEEESEFERVALRLTFTVNRGVLLPERTAGVAVVTEGTE
jgi:hypothetical protein